MNQLQAELLAENPATKIRLLGLNAVGFEDFIASAVSGRSLPYLQDTADENVWGSWAATWRDVRILDVNNAHVATYNLTSHDLANPANYAELKALLKSAAGEP